MEQTAIKEQDPPHGGSFVRRPDGSLQHVEGTKPVTAPETATPATQPAAPAGGDEE